MPTIAPLAIARLVAATSVACGGVVAVTSHPIGVAATYGPGGRVPGVEVTPGSPGHVVVHLCVELGRPLGPLGDAVRSAVTTVLDAEVPDRAPWSVDVHVADAVASPPPVVRSLR